MHPDTALADKLARAIKQALGAIERFPDGKYPMTASEIIMRDALRSYEAVRND